MEQIIFRPRIYQYDGANDFAEAFSLGERDLVLTNRYIFEPYFDTEKYPVRCIFQEEFGGGEPTDIMVDAILKKAQEAEFDRVIAIGGGTVLDIAKILAVADGHDVNWLYDHKETLKRSQKLILIPTTCGTGSEVTNISIVNRTTLGVKMGLTSESMYADAAVLIPELLKKLPFGVFATSSIDALVHAVESYLSPKATDYTRLFSRRAMEMILTGYQGLLTDGKETLPQRMEQFLRASNFAGLAFGTAGCAAVHAMSYPLGGTYHVPHGESNYAMFTGVLKQYLLLKPEGEIAELNAYLAGLLHCETAVVYDALEALLNQILPKKALHEYGVKPEELDVFTDSVMETQGRLMANNYVPLDREQVYRIYQSLY